jgi:hypothetical protein
MGYDQTGVDDRLGERGRLGKSNGYDWWGVGYVGSRA